MSKPFLKSEQSRQEAQRQAAQFAELAAIRDHLGLIIGDPLADVANFTEAKAKAKQALFTVINLFIERKPDGSPRYDTNLKLNLLIYAQSNGMSGPAAQVRAWISTLQTTYFTAKTAIEAAEDMEALRTALPAYGDLEQRFGVAGSELADPDVCTVDLLGA